LIIEDILLKNEKVKDTLTLLSLNYPSCSSIKEVNFKLRYTINSLMEALSINYQWRFFIHHCAQHAKEGIIDKIDCGVDVYWTKSNWMFFNELELFLSFAVSDELDLCRRLEDIKTYVKKIQPTFPWMLVIEVELIPLDVRERLQEICSAAEFVHVMKVKCMQTTKLLPPVRPLPTVEVKFATSQQDVYDAVLLNLQAHNMDTSIAESVVEHRAFVTNFDKELCCIVSVNGKPVSTATTVLLDKCLYVALVATCAEHRKVCLTLNLCYLSLCFYSHFM
jgi:hypothetical protein